jgi:hypothetical protein
VHACVVEPRCKGFTFWGITDRYSWIDGVYGPDDPLPFDDNYGRARSSGWVYVQANFVVRYTGTPTELWLYASGPAPGVTLLTDQFTLQRLAAP